MTDHDYVSLLQSGVFKILFHKADGSIRTIVGSLESGDTVRTPGIVPIRELGTGAFKSFKVDSVIEFAPA